MKENAEIIYLHVEFSSKSESLHGKAVSGEGLGPNKRP
jgi:hypothetical protein